MPVPSFYSFPHSLYARLVARFYDPVMRGMEERFLREKRRQLLTGTSGRILEVGAGTGANFELYPPGAEVLAIEPSGAMMRHARKKLNKLKSGARIELLEAGVEERRVAEAVPAGGFDFIVCTLVLCTVPDLKGAIRRFRQWLRPGGQLLVIEHIHDNRQPNRWLQSAVTPAWKHLAEGCHLDRPTDELLKTGGFRVVEEAYFYRWVPFYWGRLE